MFCESCGRSISDAVANCPYCNQTTGMTGGPPAPGIVTAAAQEPRRAAEAQADSRLTRAEQTIYFRIARGFSWFLLIVITVGMAGVALLLVPELTKFIGASTKVGPGDLTQAVASRQSAEEEGENELNPAEMAQLDQLAYEIIQLLPADSRPNQNVDSLRGQIKTLAATLSRERKEQMAILQELRDDLRALSETQREKAFSNYFDLKRRRIELDRSRKESAKANLILDGSFMLSGVALLTLITMILVLLSIERNTRVATG